MLDTWAVIALIREESGARVVGGLVAGGGVGISWINIGEAFYIVARREGRVRASEVVEELVASVHGEEPDRELILEAARVKADHPVSYADAFAVATAERHATPLVTGDPEILALERSALRVLDPRDRA